MKEIWKPIVGYEGLYDISSFGNVKRLRGFWCKKDRILKPWLGTHRYYIVTLRKNNQSKKHQVHRLVLLSFVGDPPTSKHECRHLNGDRIDNKIENLAWGTRSENMQDAIKHGTRYYPTVVGENIGTSILKTEQVVKIKFMLNDGIKGREIAKLFNVDESVISGIKRGKSWKHIKLET